MGLERLGLNSGQRAQIDEQFLDTTLAALHQRTSYGGMSRLTAGPLGDELEAAYVRVLDGAHKAIIEDIELAAVTVRSLGKLSFIDTLQLPSSEIFPNKSKAPDDNLSQLLPILWRDDYAQFFERLP
jgi:hypothetical protein